MNSLPLLFLAVNANAVNFHFMLSQSKAVGLANFQLVFFDQRVLELHDLVAPCANQMIVMALVIQLFKCLLTLCQNIFSGQPTLHQNIHGPVDRCNANGGVDFLNDKKQFFHLRMTLMFQENLKDGLALGREAKLTFP